MSGIGNVVGYTVTPYAYTGFKAGYVSQEDLKQGLIFPEEKKKTNTGKKVAIGIGTAAALTLAVVFRGKIKAGALDLYTKAKPFTQKALQQGKDWAQKGLKFAEPYYTKAKTVVVDLGKKVVNFFKKAPATPTP